MTALIAFVGDTHGHLKLMYERLLAWQERTGFQLSWVFQVGDFGIWPGMGSLDPGSVSHAERHKYSLREAMGDFQEIFLGDYEIPIPTYFIRGNHEDQTFLMTFEKQLMQEFPEDYLSRAAPVCHNLFYVPDSHIININGWRIAGWGGCFGEKTWERGLEYWSAARAAANQHGYAKRLNHMTQDRFERLVREQFDILVTHEIPRGTGLRGLSYPQDMIDAEEITGGGVTQINELIWEVKPRYQFGGHWHRFCRIAIGQTRCTVLDKVHPEEEDNQWLEVVDLGCRPEDLRSDREKR
jgi:hypothetical protein